MKTVLFVPGYQEDMASRDYQSVLKAIEARGYNVEFIPIKGKRTSIVQWVAELEAAYEKHESNDTILAGFSYGAMTALVAASHRNPAELWLFSLSPYFAEDIPYLRKSWIREITSLRVKAFKNIAFKSLSKQINCLVSCLQAA